MKEKQKMENTLLNNEAEMNFNDEATIPKEKDISVPIKFNKETKLLSLDEASRLAQMGMKFETIGKEYELLRRLAKMNNKSVLGFLEMVLAEFENKKREALIKDCGGNSEIADRIISLENNNPTCEVLGFEELKENFPEIGSIDTLPQAVIDAARLKGTLLLDEFLRYRLAEKKRLSNLTKFQKNTETESIGSQLNRSGSVDIEAMEFLKGLWK